MDYSNGIRSELDLCKLNFYGVWGSMEGGHSPIVSVYTREMLRSGLPFQTDPEPVRFARRKMNDQPKGVIEMYAVRWLTRYNRMLANGTLSRHKEISARPAPKTVQPLHIQR